MFTFLLEVVPRGLGWFYDSTPQLNPFKAAPIITKLADVCKCATAIMAKFTPFWKGTIAIMMCETLCVLPMCCIIIAYTGSKQWVYF